MTALRRKIAAAPVPWGGNMTPALARMAGFLGILGFVALPAMGATLNLTAHPPDVSAGFLNASYNATTGILSADGFPISFNLGGASGPTYPTIYGGQYFLNVDLTPTGQPVPGTGVLDITGTIPGLASSGTLLTGQLTNFGYQSGGGNIFEFAFDDLGGDLAPYYGGYDGETGVILDAQNSGFNGSFANSFTAGPFLSISDNTSIVPEPSTAILLLAILAFGAPVLVYRRLRCVSAGKQGLAQGY